jgi:hypothetical protein
MRRPQIALVVGLALIAAAIAIVLSSSPIAVIGTNSIAEEATENVNGDIGGCQYVGQVPRGTSAIRIPLAANSGPQVNIQVLAGSHRVSEGERAAGWGADETITVPINALAHTIDNARICTTLGSTIESVGLRGMPASTTSLHNHGLAGVALRMEYLQPGPQSWGSLLPSISRTLGFGHAIGGSWIILLLLAIMISLVALTSYLALGEIR